ncbi:MAG: FHA domain-containing protein [Kofleriaceae bacterium]|nr:FHA domain-containing protein [Kofleriaceae bacterium]
MQELLARFVAAFKRGIEGELAAMHAAAAPDGTWPPCSVRPARSRSESNGILVGMSVGIRWLGGHLAGETRVLGPVGSALVLGRDADCDVQVLDKGVSRQHLRIAVTARGVVLTDLTSLNGTFVGQQRVTECPLPFNTIVRLGDAAFELVADAMLATDEDDDIKLASGPAEHDTAVVMSLPVRLQAPTPLQARTRTPTMATKVCLHPLHAQALRERWKHCPECGADIPR